MASGPERFADHGCAQALDCIAEVIGLEDSGSARTRGLMLLCRFGAAMVQATAAGHIRLQADSGLSHWCICSSDHPDRRVFDQQLETPAAPGRDWWVISVTRRRVYEALGAGHLAELPLRTDTRSPSLIVLKRTRPFDDSDSEVLVASRPALLLIEELVDRLFPCRTPPSNAEAGYAVLLTAREREVLEMLSEGLLARSIAARLEVSERTVHKHLGSVYRKLDAHDRLLAVRRAQSLGLLKSGSPPREPVPAG
ncbi:LuxR C-terminal-related transcriptional regulator [Mycolicibacterium sp. XJ662]